jgi:hypothetical protein
MLEGWISVQYGEFSVMFDNLVLILVLVLVLILVSVSVLRVVWWRYIQTRLFLGDTLVPGVRGGIRLANSL